MPSIPITLDRDKTVTLKYTAVIPPPPPGYPIIIYVRDYFTGDYMAGASVSMDGYVGETNSAGRVDTTAVAGTYPIRAEMSGYETKTITRTISRATTIIISLTTLAPPPEYREPLFMTDYGWIPPIIIPQPPPLPPIVVEPEKYFCFYCSFVSYSESEMIVHIKSEHPDELLVVAPATP